MRNMSFSITTEQIRNHTKTVTRRLGWDFLLPGDRSESMHKIKLRYYDAGQAKLDGKALSWTDMIIMLRSFLTHEEIQFGVWRDYISYSSTLAEGAKGSRFRAIDYSHTKRWRTLVLMLNDAEELMLWEWCCNMCNLLPTWQSDRLYACTYTATLKEGQDVFAASVKDITVYQGPNHIGYDTAGLMSFALEKSGKWWLDGLRVVVWYWTKVIRPDPVKMFCSEACCNGINHIKLACGRYAKAEIDPQESYEQTKLWAGVKEVTSD